MTQYISVDKKNWSDAKTYQTFNDIFSAVQVFMVSLQGFVVEKKNNLVPKMAWSDTIVINC